MKKKFYCLLLSLILAIAGYAQLQQRSFMTHQGNYDIKMISSVALQPAWITSANPFVVKRILTDDEMRADSYYLQMNNYVSDGSNNAVTLLDPAYLSIKPSDAIGVAMVYADCDVDMSTFQSSTAFLDFGMENASTNIAAAYLYWTGNNDTCVTKYAAYPGLSTLRSYPGGAVGAINGEAYKTILFKAPGDNGYTPITSSRSLGSLSKYICFADVTPYVKGKGSGLYWVGNIRSSSAKNTGGATGGWTLVVLYSQPTTRPHEIKFWDGVQDMSSGSFTSIQLDLSAGYSAPTKNFNSYLGVAALDGENLGSFFTQTAKSPEFLEFQSKSSVVTGPLVKINPFADGQTYPFAGEPLAGYPVYDKKGNLLSSNAQDGFSCSRITSWDDVTGTNGNAITRLPSLQNTLGYDAHHLKLPEGAMCANATSATVNYYAGAQGGLSLFLAYLSVEVKSSRLTLTEAANVSSTTANGEYTYTFKVKNEGDLASDTTAYIIDTLNKVVNFVPGSIVYKDKAGNIITPSVSPIITQNGDTSDVVKLYIPAIQAGENNSLATDSVWISFKVKVKDATRTDIWGGATQYFIKNYADLYYTSSIGTVFNSKSNSLSGYDSYSPVVVSVDLTTTGLSLANKYKMDLQPNPTSGKIIVSGITEPTVVRVSTLNGQLLLKKNLNVDGSISLEDFADGIYLVSLENTVSLEKFKVIKK